MLDDDKQSLLVSGAISIAFGGLCAVLPEVPFVYSIGFFTIGAAAIAQRMRGISKFDILFRNCKLCFGDVRPLLISKKKLHDKTVYKFSIPAGLSLEDFKNKIPALEAFCDSKVDVGSEGGKLILSVYKSSMPDYVPYKAPSASVSVPILIGVDITGRQVIVDMSHGEPHMVIAGSSGAGKSTALRSIITTLIISSDVELYLVDLKNGVEFNMFRKSKNVLGFARSETEALHMFKDIVSEIDRRYDMFYNDNTVSISEYNKRNKRNQMTYKVVIVDEFASLMHDKQTQKFVETVSQKARACGIYMILATQRPDAKVLSGIIKSNIANVLGLRTKDVTNSRIIIDRPGLERLKGKGNGILVTPTIDVEIQVPYISEDDAKKMIKPYDRKEIDIVNKVESDEEFLRRLG